MRTAALTSASNGFDHDFDSAQSGSPSLEDEAHATHLRRELLVRTWLEAPWSPAHLAMPISPVTLPRYRGCAHDNWIHEVIETGRPGKKDALEGLPYSV